MQRRIFLAVIVALLVVVGLAPVLSMLARSLFVDGRLSLAAYRGLLASPRQWTLMAHSAALACLVTALAVGIGVPLGILFGKTDLPLRRLFTALFVVPLLVPPYIVAVSWVDLLGRDGLAAGLLGAGAAAGTARLLEGLPGCTAVLFSVFLPVPMLLTMVFLRSVDPRLEEAGRLVSGWWGVMRGITMPLVLPGVLLAGLLVFLLTLGEFTVASFLRYPVFAVESFTQFSAFYDFQAATAAAVPLAGVTLLVLLVEARFLRDRTYRVPPAAGGDGGLRIGLGAGRPWISAAVAALGIVLVAVPVLALLVQAGGVDAYAEALRRAGASLVRSLLYAAAGATLLTVVGFFTGYLVQGRVLACWRSVDSLTVFLFALPGTVIGIGLIGLWNRPWSNLVYGTPLIVLLGYLAKYTALTSRISVSQLARVPASMEEAAQVAGAGWFRRMAWIVAPLARRGLAAGWVVGYIFSLRDTGITMMVYPPGHETLPVRIFTLMANGSPRLIAALCVVTVVAALLPASLFWVAGAGSVTRRVGA